MIFGVIKACLVGFVGVILILMMASASSRRYYKKGEEPALKNSTASR